MKQIQQLEKICNSKRYLKITGNIFRLLFQSSEEFDKNVIQGNQVYPSIDVLKSNFLNSSNFLLEKISGFDLLVKLLDSAKSDVQRALAQIGEIENLKEDLLRKDHSFQLSSKINNENDMILSSQDSVNNLSSKEQICFKKMLILNQILEHFYNEKKQFLKKFRQLIRDEFQKLFLEFKQLWKKKVKESPNFENTHLNNFSDSNHLFNDESTIIANTTANINDIPETKNFDFDNILLDKDNNIDDVLEGNHQDTGNTSNSYKSNNEDLLNLNFSPEKSEFNENIIKSDNESQISQNVTELDTSFPIKNNIINKSFDNQSNVSKQELDISKSIENQIEIKSKEDESVKSLNQKSILENSRDISSYTINENQYAKNNYNYIPDESQDEYSESYMSYKQNKSNSLSSLDDTEDPSDSVKEEKDPFDLSNLIQKEDQHEDEHHNESHIKDNNTDLKNGQSDQEDSIIVENTIHQEDKEDSEIDDYNNYKLDFYEKEEPKKDIDIYESQNVNIKELENFKILEKQKKPSQTEDFYEMNNNLNDYNFKSDSSKGN